MPQNSQARASEAMSNGCPQVEATLLQTAAVQDLAAAVREAMEALRPAAEAVAELGTAQKKLCAFAARRRLMIVGSLLTGLTAIGAISPNAAHAIATLLNAWGVQ